MLTRPTPHFYPALSLLVLVACAPTENTAASEAASVADPNASAAARGACPASLPAAGDGCGGLYLACEYGDDPRPDCRSIARCQDGAWKTRAADKCGPYVETPLPACPYTRAQMRNEAETCTTMEAICLLPDNKVCVCHNCGDVSYSFTPCTQPRRSWHCEPPSPGGDSSCPPLERPKIGSSCSPEGASCTYSGICADLPPLECQAGSWQENSPPLDCSSVDYSG